MLVMQPDSISAAIVDFFNTKDIDLNKMIMFTSDGAAVMLGCNNGVHIKLKSFCTHLIEYHCVAHREALAAGDAYKSVSYFVQLESTIKAIFSHFAHSSVRTANLKHLFVVLDKKYIRLRKIHDIRWLSRLEAVEAVVKTYDVLVTYFEDLSDSDFVAAGLVKQLKSYRFVVSLHFLLDVLSGLGQLNKTFQILSYHPIDAHHKIKEVSQALRSRYLGDTFRWGPKATECLQQIHNGVINVMNTGDEVMSKLRKDCVSFVTSVVRNLASRFPHTQGIVEAARIFDPKNLPEDENLGN